MLIQASMLHLETGQWSGFNRQTTASESSTLQMLTVSLLRLRLFTSKLMLNSCSEGLVEQVLHPTQIRTLPALAIPLKYWRQNGVTLLQSSPAKGSLHSTY